LASKCSTHRDEPFALFIFIFKILELEIKFSARGINEEGGGLLKRKEGKSLNTYETHYISILGIIQVNSE
jgi:hypothetical protein